MRTTGALIAAVDAGQGLAFGAATTPKWGARPAGLSFFGRPG